MKKLVVLCLLLSLNVIYHNVNCLKLVNLCEEDHFEYERTIRMKTVGNASLFPEQRMIEVKKNITVNSVYFSEQLIQLGTFRSYLMSPYHNCDLPEDSAEARESTAIKNDYNELFVQIYSDEHLNRKNITKTLLKELEQIEQWQNKITEIGGRVKKLYDDVCVGCFEDYFEWPIREGECLLKGILPLYDHQLHELESTETLIYRPSKQMLFPQLQKAIEAIRFGVETGQTLAFIGEPVGHVYKQRIASFPRFGFLKYQPEALNLILDFVFPFYNKRFDSSQKCLSANELPPFFQQKGKQPN